MLVVGLTGGIGSGKSLVSRAFEDKAITVVDADVIARQVVQKGQPALDRLAAHFGREVLTPTGELDRAALREQIFNQPEERVWLEQLLHPIIRTQTLSELEAAQSPYAVLVSPLLLETDQRSLVDVVAVVDVSEETQLARASARDKVPLAQIRQIMAAQMPRAERLAQADHVIDNNGTVDATLAQVNQLHQILSSRANQ